MAIDLTALRTEIETLDRELLALLKRRMGLSEQIAQAKLQSAAPFRDPLREAQVLVKVRERAAAEGLDPHATESLFRLVMQMSIARQQQHVEQLEEAPLRVAYPGVEGGELHQAARERYPKGGRGVLLIAVDNAHEAADAVAKGIVDHALLPIESTRGGSLDETYELAASLGLYFTGEVIALFDEALFGLPGATLDRVQTVLTDPDALARSRPFFRSHRFDIVRASDAAAGAEEVLRRKDPSCAVVATAGTAKQFGLVELARNLEGIEHSTRIVELSRAPAEIPPGTRAKSSLLIELSHRPGALGEVLGQLSALGANLTKIESRPVPGDRWRYRFFLDVEGNAAAPPLSQALEAIRPIASELRLLGSYERAEQG